MNRFDLQYQELLENILLHGYEKGDRTGTGTISTFGTRMDINVSNEFPLLTLKYTPFRLIAEELFWFIDGGDSEKGMNERDLAKKDVHIWKPWSAEDGSLGPVYGSQWRSWPKQNGDTTEYIDQLKDCEYKLRHNPDDRRIIVSAWNVSELENMALPPCHLMFQFYSFEDEGRRYLDLQMMQRSVDYCVGLPFNVASYSLLLHLMALTTDHIPNRFIWIGGDTHIYNNHIDAVNTMLEREPYSAPQLQIHNKKKSITDYTIDDVGVVNYKSHPKIKAEVAV